MADPSDGIGPAETIAALRDDLLRARASGSARLFRT